MRILGCTFTVCLKSFNNCFRPSGPQVCCLLNWFNHLLDDYLNGKNKHNTDYSFKDKIIWKFIKEFIRIATIINERAIFI